MRGNVPSKKKPSYPIRAPFRKYLRSHYREVELPITYDDLLRFDEAFPLLDTNGDDTLWMSVMYSQSVLDELNIALRDIYAVLKVDGDVNVIEHLRINRIDFCKFGNSQPFRIRIENHLNDNYDLFYVKKADASRVYGLELEDIVSPNRLRYMVDGNTLIEEHVAGVPGDIFMKRLPGLAQNEKIRIVKEFVKFNERCFIRLLGDMRSYNYVVDITPDIEGNQYRIRAIDFDQQSFEGRKSFYLPQFFKENNPIIMMGMELLNPTTVRQYQIEERSMIAARIKTEVKRTNRILRIMRKDKIGTREKALQLRTELAAHHNSHKFDDCNTMGDIVRENINLLLSKEFRQAIG